MHALQTLKILLHIELISVSACLYSSYVNHTVSPQCESYLCSSTVGALFGYLVEVFHVAAVQSQQSSELREQDARTCPDARAGPRYQSHFVLQGRHLHTHTHAHALKSLSAVHPVDSSPSTNEPIFNWDEFNYVQSVKVTRHRKIQGSNMTSCDRKLTYFKRVARCHDFCGVCARACASSTSDDAIWRVRLWSVVHTGLQHYSLLYSSKQNLSSYLLKHTYYKFKKACKTQNTSIQKVLFDKKKQFIYTDHQERKEENLNNIAVKSQVLVLGLNEDELVLNYLYLIVIKT